MTPLCQVQSRLVEWSRHGAGLPLPDTLREHAARCEACREILDEVLEVRSIAGKLPVHRASEDRLGEIRFAIMAEARREGPRTQPSQPRVRRSKTRWSAAAVFFVLLATVVGGLAMQPVRAHSNVIVTLHGEAQGMLAGSNEDEVYVLVRGEAEFEVNELDQGSRFRAVAGGDVIEVRGTHFAVEVADGGLAGVAVTEGRVLVRLDEGIVDLRRGDRWQRTSSFDREADDQPVVRAHKPAARVARGDAVLDGADGMSVPESFEANGSPSAPRRREAPGSVPVPGRLEPAGSPPVSGRLDPPLRANTDAAFRRAWQLYHAGEADQAAGLFDALLKDPALDGARRSDVLYWSARAHAKLGDSSASDERARAVLESEPGAWHAAESALLLGESLLAQGKHDDARRALLRAASSPRANVRARAIDLLRSVPSGGVKQPTGAPK
jgi:TolA-binding protein